MPEYTNHQLLLMRLRDEECDGNAAELARRIEKASSYVNRLFYLPGKKGAKGIGLDIIQACNKAFTLPPGYWDMPATNAAYSHTTLSTAHRSIGSLIARDNDASHLPLWPFKTVKPAQWSLLSEKQQAHVEDGVKLMLEARASPAKQPVPGAAAKAT